MVDLNGNGRLVVLKYAIGLLVTQAVLVAVHAADEKESRAFSGLLDGIDETCSTGQSNDAKETQTKMIGLREDYRLQDCQSSYFKQSFPNVDYALLGYNILRGYPHANGADPGFTYQIFHADYKSGGMTADCQYSVPDGLLVIPDVSCETSFDSTVTSNIHTFDKSLMISAHAEASGWGISFSASGEYRTSSSEISKGETVYIISSAKCHYYFSKLIPGASPLFDDLFLQWIYKLNNTYSESSQYSHVYNEFLDTYGTHFLTHVTFGARYTHEHKMSAKEYQKQTEEGINVAVEASFASLFSIGGGFGLDSSRRESASNFSKCIETRTITVGAAPPSNGDAMTWASTVKTKPVPVSYTLSSIESLFSEKYIRNPDIDYTRIAKNVEKHKPEYCLYLQRIGQVESCERLTAGITLHNTLITTYGTTLQTAVPLRSLAAPSLSACIETCLEKIDCVAISFCISCPPKHKFYQKCIRFTESRKTYAVRTEGPHLVWQSNIFPDKAKSDKVSIFYNTAILGTARVSQESLNDENCDSWCVSDGYCVAFSVMRNGHCKLYNPDQIQGLETSDDYTTYFLSGNIMGRIEYYF